MSKKKQDQEITLEVFRKMNEAEQQALPSKDYMRLLSEQQEADQTAANLKEAEQIKAKHYKAIGGRGVFLLEVGDARAWLRNVDRKLLSMLTASASDPIEQCELLIDNLWLEGDERLKNDDDFFLGAVNQLKQLMHVKTGSLKKF